MRVRKLIPIVLVIATLFPTLGETAAHARSTRNRIMAKINSIRAHQGVRRLDCVAPIDNIAQGHSVRMARTRTMYHTPNLYSKLRARVRVRTWGENVGYAPRWWRVVTLWMRSPSHRHNILNGRFNRCGVGVAKAGGRFWVTMIYVG